MLLHSRLLPNREKKKKHVLIDFVKSRWGEEGKEDAMSSIKHVIFRFPGKRRRGKRKHVFTVCLFYLHLSARIQQLITHPLYIVLMTAIKQSTNKQTSITFCVDVLNWLFWVLINRSENNSCPFPVSAPPLHFTFKTTRRVFSLLNSQQGGQSMLQLRGCDRIVCQFLPLTWALHRPADGLKVPAAVCEVDPRAPRPPTPSTIVCSQLSFSHSLPRMSGLRRIFCTNLIHHFCGDAQ